MTQSSQPEAQGEPKHTPGPWQLERPTTMSYSRCWYVYRDKGDGTCEYMLNKRKCIAFFLKEATALAAIVKATGAQP